jgi:hypothetical protein
VDELHEIADDLESIEFWYKTPHEKNIALLMQSAEERRNAVKKYNRWGDLGFVTFPAFDPDAFLVVYLVLSCIVQGRRSSSRRVQGNQVPEADRTPRCLREAAFKLDAR